MVQYSVQPRDQIFIKGYWFLSFAKNMGKNINENVKQAVIWLVMKLLIELRKSQKLYRLLIIK